MASLVGKRINGVLRGSCCVRVLRGNSFVRTFQVLHGLPLNVAHKRPSSLLLFSSNSSKNLVQDFVRRSLSSESPNIGKSPKSTSAESTVSSPSGSVYKSIINFSRRYGYTALAFHTGFSGISLLLWWAVVKSPSVDVPEILGRLGFLSPLALLLTKTAESFGTGTFVIAYVLHKATGPLRLLLTIVITPLLVRRYGARQAATVLQNTKL